MADTPEAMSDPPAVGRAMAGRSRRAQPRDGRSARATPTCVACSEREAARIHSLLCDRVSCWAWAPSVRDSPPSDHRHRAGGARPPMEPPMSRTWAAAVLRGRKGLVRAPAVSRAPTRPCCSSSRQDRRDDRTLALQRPPPDRRGRSPPASHQARAGGPRLGLRQDYACRTRSRRSSAEPRPAQRPRVDIDAQSMSGTQEPPLFSIPGMTLHASLRPRARCAGQTAEA